MNKFNCNENDNYIKVEKFDGKIHEISVGCDDAPSYGESVIGFYDLKECLYENGYSLTKSNLKRK